MATFGWQDEAAVNSEALQLGSKQLVGAALGGKWLSRVPTGPLAVHFCARVAGYTLRRYSTHARLLAESVIRYYERFRPDAIWLSADTWVSAEAMGAKVGATDPDQPLCGMGGPTIRSLSDVTCIPPPTVVAQGRFPIMLEALAHLVVSIGQDVFVVACFDQYPFSLAAALLGMNETMLKLTDDPPLIEALMEQCLAYGLAYARALSDAGADMLSGGDSPAGLLGPETYRRVAWPFEQRLIASLKAATRKPVSLHICGNALPLLTDMAATGADVLEIDHKTDLAAACRIVPQTTTLWGNLDPVGLLAQGSVAEVTQAARQAIATVQAASRRRFVLSSGCTLTMETPFENLDALLQAAR